MLIGEGYERVFSPLSPSPQRRLLFEDSHSVVTLAHNLATAGGINPSKSLPNNKASVNEDKPLRKSRVPEKRFPFKKSLSSDVNLLSMET